ncbi:uncharacterized protein PFL1_04522 [Pseudozyma flocculosa PF-1]|nr:uncharacterized protein PFL1_04522 [Pseudozyma flocculosa PF-1]EPQ27777.1 hypothetical protein PFL1_04522 [Pseudozyma flocculosa PF-1]
MSEHKDRADGQDEATTCQDCSPDPAATPVQPAQAQAPIPAPAPVEESAKEDILDKSTFIPPLSHIAGDLPSPSLVIEFCHRCRFYPRASWIQTELWLTFPPDESCILPPPSSSVSKEGGKGGQDQKKEGHINAILLLPRTSQETGGRFRIWINLPPSPPLPSSTTTTVTEEKGREGAVKWDLIWDRKTDGGFPELRKLKQLIRDRIAPGSGLGHSDKTVS